MEMVKNYKAEILSIYPYALVTKNWKSTQYIVYSNDNYTQVLGKSSYSINSAWANAYKNIFKTKK